MKKRIYLANVESSWKKHENKHKEIFYCYCGAVLEKEPRAPTVLRCPKCGQKAVIDRKGWIYFI